MVGKVDAEAGLSGGCTQVDLSTADAALFGESANDFAGEALAGAGDVNGDGRDDLLIGVPGQTSRSTAEYAGKAYLIFSGL